MYKAARLTLWAQLDRMEDLERQLTESRNLLFHARAKNAKLIRALEIAFMALGRLGNNVIDGPERKAWEAASAALKEQR